MLCGNSRLALKSQDPLHGYSAQMSPAHPVEDLALGEVEQAGTGLDATGLLDRSLDGVELLEIFQSKHRSKTVYSRLALGVIVQGEPYSVFQFCVNRSVDNFHTLTWQNGTSRITSAPSFLFTTSHRC